MGSHRLQPHRKIRQVTEPKIPGYDEYINSKQWSKKREQFFREGNHTFACWACEAPREPYFEVHHRTYKRLRSEDLRDLVLLCKPCHVAIHKIHRKGFEKSLFVVTNEFIIKKRKELGKKPLPDIYFSPATPLEPKYQTVTKIVLTKGRCEKLNTDNTRCRSQGQLENGLCHVHKPNGKFQKQRAKKKETFDFTKLTRDVLFALILLARDEFMEMLKAGELGWGCYHGLYEDKQLCPHDLQDQFCHKGGRGLFKNYKPNDVWKWIQQWFGLPFEPLDYPSEGRLQTIVMTAVQQGKQAMEDLYALLEMGRQWNR
jgi:5-methylcytosine-specific restriction endonuclease McrA